MPLRAAGLFALLSATSLIAEAQLGPGGNPLQTVRYGCDWTNTTDTSSNNTGFLDSTATYTVTTLPVNPGNRSRILIRGTFPRVRYFSFQIYDGFRPGNFVDSVPDAIITPTGGGAPSANPAVLPLDNGYTATYQLQVIYRDPPANPANRLPNTLYAGVGAPLGVFNKTLLYRTYLPNTGSRGFGSTELPDLIYEGPEGRIDLGNTPDTQGCAAARLGNDLLRTFPVPGVGQNQARIAFRPVSGRGAGVFYPNGDSNYLRAQTGRLYAPLIVVRARLPVAPVQPPLLVADPDVRYYSLCQNDLNTSRNVGCLTDRDLRVQADGSFTAVISTPANRPNLARPEFGYNWLPFGDQLNGLTVLRQILAKPGFEGDFAKAVARPTQPLSNTLGRFAPDITYCDRATFTAFAASGGAALVDACRKNFTLVGGLLGL
ncbi:MAG: hypothetical protein C0434_11850 [Xanthomonadaceae bacterium]|nr:hypothetical protein [Xanthomonadaceae bacterium]